MIEVSFIFLSLLKCQRALPFDEQRQAILRNVQVLSNISRAEVNSFAYPFGGPCISDTKQILLESGIKVACSVNAEPIKVGCDPLELPRLEVRNWTGEEFEKRLRSLLDA